MHLYREQKLYGNGKDPSQVTDLTALKSALANIPTSEISDISHYEFVDALSPESIENAKQLIAGGIHSDMARAFVDFVALCERKERETGEPCTITVPY